MAKFGHGYNIRRAGPNGDFMRRRKTSFSKKYLPRYLLDLQRNYIKIMEVKDLKLSSSFYFADYDQLK